MCHWDWCRYYGSVSTYGDIFRFVRARLSLLEGYTNATAFSSDGDGGGDAALASDLDVFVYVRQPGVVASNATRVDFAVHVVDFRADEDPDAPSAANVTLSLRPWFAERLPGCPAADVSTTITVYVVCGRCRRWAVW